MDKPVSVTTNPAKNSPVYDDVYEDEAFILLYERHYAADGSYTVSVDTAVADNWTLYQFMEEYMGIASGSSVRIESEIIGYYPSGKVDRRDVIRAAVERLRLDGVEVDRCYDH